MLAVLSRREISVNEGVWIECLEENERCATSCLGLVTAVNAQQPADRTTYCRVLKGYEPASERRCYQPGKMGSDALRERQAAQAKGRP